MNADQKLQHMKDQFTEQVVGEDTKPPAGKEIMDAVNAASKRPEGYHWSDEKEAHIGADEPETERVVKPEHRPSPETMERFQAMQDAAPEPEKLSSEDVMPASEVVAAAATAGAEQARKGLTSLLLSYLTDAQKQRAQGKIALSDDFLNGMATMYNKAVEAEALANKSEASE